MSQSGDVAETMTRMYLQGFEVGLRVTGAGAEKIMALILATMKDKRKTTGKTNLTNMLKSGKELKVFSVKQEDLRKFAEEAKRYGVLYSALINKKAKDGVVDILVKSEDASKINRIVEHIIPNIKIKESKIFNITFKIFIFSYLSFYFAYTK